MNDFEIDLIDSLVDAAKAEDQREGSHFDAEGFSNFFPEEDPKYVQAARLQYEYIIYGQK